MERHSFILQIPSNHSVQGISIATGKNSRLLYQAMPLDHEQKQQTGNRNKTFLIRLTQAEAALYSKDGFSRSQSSKSPNY